MNDAKTKKQGNKTAKKVPRKVTKDRLRNIALYQLERYATSAQNLKRVLERRVFKAARHHDTNMEEAKGWINEIVDALVRSGAIDDTRYAEGKAVSMIRRGQSSSKVRAYLASKGVNSETVGSALETAKITLGDPELKAARAYALRRHFGPYRTSEDSPDVRQKELAAFGRAGFRYDIANKIINAVDESELDDQS